MGLFQVTTKHLVIFLVLNIAYNNSFVTTQARSIKPFNQLSSLSSENLSVTHATGFRRTTPRSDPGVSHRKFSMKDKNMKTTVVVQSPNGEVFVTERSDDGFKPTTPSHSPGVGHAYHTKIGHLN